MSLRDNLKKGLVTIAAVAALSMPASGCVQGKQYQTLQKVNMSVETYVLDYDMPTMQQAIKMYVADKGKMPQTWDDIGPYRFVSVDVNDNGVLDYQRELKLYKVDGKVIQIYVMELTRAEATDAKRPIVKETWLTLNKDKSVTVKTRSVTDVPNAYEPFIKAADALRKEMGDLKVSSEKAARAYGKIKDAVAKPKGAQ